MKEFDSLIKKIQDSIQDNTYQEDGRIYIRNKL